MADNIKIYDADSTTQYLRSTEAPTGVHTPHHIVSNLPTDAFSRMRVSEPRPIGDYNLTYGLEELLMEEIKTGTGNDVTFSTDTRMASLVLGGTAVGHAKLQSYQYHYYQPGRSHTIFLTGVFEAAVANTTKRLGYFDDNNGIFLQQSADGSWGFAVRSKTGGTVVNDLVDSADWSHQPGWTIDATKNVIIAFDLQFLGMGLVRCYEDRDGILTLLHQFEHEQSIAVPYMQTATLPVRAEVIQTTTAAAASMKFKCASVMTEGGTDDAAGLAFTKSATATAGFSGGNPARAHAISIQPKALFGTVENRPTIEIESVDVIVTGNNPVLVELCIGDVITGTTTFNDVNATHSGVEWNTAGTTSGAPTAVIASAFIASGATVKGAVSRKLVNRYPLTLDAAGVARANGRFTVLLSSLTTGTSTCWVALNWREIR